MRRRLIPLTALTTMGWLAQSAGAAPSPDTPMASRWHVGSTWAVLVFAPDHQLVGSMVVRITNEKAISCISGDWKRLELVRREFKDPADFLATKPLSYLLDGSELTLGVTEVCDGYVLLHGVPTNEGLAGDYGTLGLGGFHKLGSFAAVIVKE